MGRGYSKTTTRTVRNRDGTTTTYRTTQRRTGLAAHYLGPYQSKEDKRALWIFVGLFVLLGWPWFISTIPVWARALIAVPYYVALLVAYGAVLNRRRRRQ